MTPRLDTLVIENFRSLKGRIVLPLNAQTVLIHGSNGMGKTSVLSALELALTGDIAHLADKGGDYRSFFAHLGTAKGSISLTTTAAIGGASDHGQLNFSVGAQGADPLIPPPTTVDGTPLLTADLADFFAKRCYLPQATLGRLLEIYDTKKSSDASPLTDFVKELLKLDPLDALVDGLHSAGHITRIRNLIPEYRRLDTLKKSLEAEIAGLQKQTEALAESLLGRDAALTNHLALLSDAPTMPPSFGMAILRDQIDTVAFRTRLEAQRAEDAELAAVRSKKSRLERVGTDWSHLKADAPEQDRAEKELLAHNANDALERWRTGAGLRLETILTELAELIPDLRGMDRGPRQALDEARSRAEAELERCSGILQRSADAVTKLDATDQIITRAEARIGEINTALEDGARDAQSLAHALAGIAPHVRDDTCPVCDRAFNAEAGEPLASHIAAKIAALTTEAGRMQALASERAEESGRLATAQRDRLAFASEQLDDDRAAELAIRQSRLRTYIGSLTTLTDVADQGAALSQAAEVTRQQVDTARRRISDSHDLYPELEQLIGELTGASLASFATVPEGIAAAIARLDEAITQVEAAVVARSRALGELALIEREQEEYNRTSELLSERNLHLADIVDAEAHSGEYRTFARRIAEAALRVRSDIVANVFNTTLNRIWRDLFVRLAPSEHFVPSFRLPTADARTVEAKLETVHRSGMVSGTPGAMLSQGNLNTAALTLFLALHLSVPAQLPWLILDDPVQSMDDVHIAQFAALLRTLSKRAGRQVIIAVHEKALFDYLTLELSPATPDDTLLTVEISREANGDAKATPKFWSHSEDRAIAA